MTPSGKRGLACVFLAGEQPKKSSFSGERGGGFSCSFFCKSHSAFLLRTLVGGAPRATLVPDRGPSPLLDGLLELSFFAPGEKKESDLREKRRAPLLGKEGSLL